VVIDQIDVVRISAGEAEGDAPVPAYYDRPDSLLVSLQFVKALSGASEIARARCGVEHRKNVGNADSEEGINEAILALFEQLPKPLMTEARDHDFIVS